MFDSWWLVQPSSIMLLALLLGALALAAGARRLGTFLVIVSLLIVAVPTTFDVAGRLAWELERQVDPPERLPHSVDGILVLGGALDWNVSKERGQLNVNSAGERLMAAAALARRYPDARVALTGVYRENVANEFLVRPEASSLIFGEEYDGRPVEFIGEARSTYEEGLLALERLKPRAGQTWLLVTSAMHMPRALAVFAQLGWRLTPYPVDYQTAGRPALLNSDPRPGVSLARLDEVVREWGGLIVYRQTGRIDGP